MYKSKNIKNYGFLAVLLLAMVSCGEGEPVADPILHPRSMAQNPFVESLNFRIVSGYSKVFYTFSMDGPAEEPNCTDSGFDYEGPFLIGGPNETVSIRAIACDGDDSSEVVDRTYIFGERDQ
ncbi:hypothetical protein MRY82_01440 [bacterium]|nr:hypothetical protein [bacterium]